VDLYSALSWSHLVRCSGMAHVLKGSHSFTCTPRVHPLSEWTIPAGPRLWNSLPISLRKISSYGQFSDIWKIIYLGFEISQRSVTHDSLRYINILTYLLTYLLPLPSQPKLALIYRPRRDGRLSWPWVAGWLHTEIDVRHCKQYTMNDSGYRPIDNQQRPSTPCLNKNCATIHSFVHKFDKCWPIFNFFHCRILHEIGNKIHVIYLATL